MKVLPLPMYGGEGYRMERYNADNLTEYLYLQNMKEKSMKSVQTLKATLPLYKAEEVTEACLDYFVRQNPGIEIIPVINDGNYKEWTKFFDKKEYPIPRIIFNSKNNISSAWNKGIRQIFKDNPEDQYAMVISNDVLVPAITTQRLFFGCSEKRPLTCASVMYESSLEEGEEFKKELSDRFILKREPSWCNRKTFSCYVIERKFFESSGGFDENFKIYWGDTDFVVRNYGYSYKMETCEDALVCSIGRSSLRSPSEIDSEMEDFLDTITQDADFFFIKWKDSMEGVVHIINKHMSFHFNMNQKGFDKKQYRHNEEKARVSVMARQL